MILMNLKLLGRQNIEGKIVFFNRPVDNKLINSFAGYGGAVNQRTQEHLKLQNMEQLLLLSDQQPSHLMIFLIQGLTRYEEGVNKIPAVAVSTIDAELLKQMA